ncbi:MAG: hypothetical protein KKA07_16820, partial [Bacteroidetes bacterium]|nr:hypothetical protein [Bacteroidota bacterium]
IMVNPIAFPDGIGTDNLIRKDDVCEEIWSNSEYQNVNGVNIRTISICSVSTWQVNFIIKREKTFLQLITAFPGKMAPPFPEHFTKKTLDYFESVNFWQNHAFASKLPSLIRNS